MKVYVVCEWDNDGFRGFGKAYLYKSKAQRHRDDKWEGYTMQSHNGYGGVHWTVEEIEIEDGQWWNL